MFLNTLTSVVLGLSFAAIGQAGPATEPPTQPGNPPGAASEADAVVVMVDGEPIRQSEVDRVFQAIVRQQTGGRPLPPEQMNQVRQQLGPRIVENLINERLLDAAVEEAELAMTDKEFNAEMEKAFANYLVRADMTRAEFAEQLQVAQGVSIDQFIEDQAKEPEFRQAALQEKLIEKKFPEKIAVTEKEVAEQYASARDADFTQPAEVKASHILVKVEPDATPDAKQAARKEAETLLAKVKVENADFATVAKEHSECPSSAQGGDLGYFAREGKMVEPFAAAAFKLKEGEVSDIVQTQFGYHIIRVTDRKEANVVPLREAAPLIREQLSKQKIAETRDTYLATLRKDARIVYPDKPSGGESAGS